jgi:hypothetical protein
VIEEKRLELQKKAEKGELTAEEQKMIAKALEYYKEIADRSETFILSILKAFSLIKGLFAMSDDEDKGREP